MSPSAAVNKPVDVKLKDKDVNNKLQLYGIYTAFAKGKTPSNKQIDIALNSLLASEALSRPPKKLSPDGQKFVTDLRNAIEQAKLLVLTKNDGNLLQDFIWQTQQISGGGAQAPIAPVDKDTARQHGSEALEGLRTLGTLIISNGQFRKLLNDVQILFQDIVGDAASHVATVITPTEEQLAQIDRPAEDNTWHDVPDISRDKLTSQFKDQWGNKKPLGRSDVENAAQRASDAATSSNANDSVDINQGAVTGVDTLQNTADKNVPEKTKDRHRKLMEKSRHYWEKKMPKDRRDQFVFRLKKMIIEIQGHQDYMRAVETILRLVERYAGHSRSLLEQGHGAIKGAHTDDSLQNAEADLKTLIERFANYTSLDDLIDSINRIYRDADEDPELRQWFKDFDTYIRKCLKEQGYIMLDESNDEWNDLYDHGRYLFRDRYRNHTDRILDEFKFVLNQFDADPQNKAFGNSLATLFNDLGSDKNGKPAFKPHLVKDLTDVILPGIFESIRYVPVPRIEYTDPTIDVIIENLVIESDNLTPNILELGSDNYWRWGRKNISSRSKNKIMLSVSGIQMDLRDVSYYVKRKQGMPKLSDKGVADIFLGGDGLSFSIEMETADKKTSQGHLFKVNKVSVDVKNISIKLKTSTHKILFSIVKPLLLKLMRPALEKVVEMQLRDNLNQLDQLAFIIRQEVKKAEADLLANPNPENAENIFQRYVDAVNKQMLQGRERAERFVEDKKVNVAVTKQDSIFQNISLPGGISTKATEFKELATKGDKWESPVFSIGSSGETRELPKVPAVSRKHHRTSVSSRTPANAATTNIGSTTNQTTGLNGNARALGEQMDRSLGMNDSSNANAVRAGANGNPMV